MATVVEHPRLKSSLSKDIFSCVTDQTPLRELTDPRSMRALAHPLRLSLLELLRHEGPLTATEAGERIGETPASCSFHLRQLAKYGFVEEAPRKGGGRRRPWRAVDMGMRFTDVHDDPETAEAAIGLERVLRDRNLRRAQAGLDGRLAQPREWRETLGMSDYTLYVTPDELRAVDEAILATARRYQHRIEDPAQRPEGSQPIQLLWMAYPYRPGDDAS
jgi:DNA-binding transcriptional ArsR family regulator